jgi:hypothetical protein
MPKCSEQRFVHEFKIFVVLVVTALPGVVAGQTFFGFCIAVEPFLSFIVNVFRVGLFFVLKFPRLSFRAEIFGSQFNEDKHWYVSLSAVFNTICEFF